MASGAVISLIGIAFGILQSSLLPEIIPFGTVPDLALIILIAASWKQGSLSGEISGFLIGLGFDVMSLAPLGYHAFLYTLIGYIFGRLKDNIAPGAVLLPVLAVLSGTLIKYLLSFVMSLIFGLNSSFVQFFSTATIWELLENLILAPALFLLVVFISRLAEGKRGGFR
ncbi:MAG: rod shape-determining protein MreD [Spirochaetaceae bacterium]|nr:rod shape-determining protein MreD [Spirochaetaceae bacterium]